MSYTYKIVTERNTSFILGFPKDTAQDSPKIVELQLLYESQIADHFAYLVKYDDLTEVFVGDVVEYWKKS
jgi:hypothetical protein